MNDTTRAMFMSQLAMGWLAFAALIVASIVFDVMASLGMTLVGIALSIFTQHFAQIAATDVLPANRVLAYRKSFSLWLMSFAAAAASFVFLLLFKGA